MTELERQILNFEAHWWQLAGNKESEIVRRFRMSAIRYAQKLNQILDNPEALAHDPILVNRLQRIRSERADARTQRRGIRGL